MIQLLIPAAAGYFAYHCIHTKHGRSIVAKMTKTVLKEAGVAEKTITKLAKTATETFKKEESGS